MGAQIKLLFFLMVTTFLLFMDSAFAAQVFGTSDGIYAHQLAHFFFMSSMVLLICRLRQRKLFYHAGWKYIQYAAVLFILWNVNVMLVHFLEKQAGLITMERISAWQIRVSSSLGSGTEIIYCFAKLDHLIFVPALYFLFLGLRTLVTDTEKPSEDSIR